MREFKEIETSSRLKIIFRFQTKFPLHNEITDEDESITNSDESDSDNEDMEHEPITYFENYINNEMYRYFTCNQFMLHGNERKVHQHFTF